MSSQAEPARERVLFAFKGQQIDDVETAHQFVEHEEDTWVATQHDTSWYINGLVKMFTKNGLGYIVVSGAKDAYNGSILIKQGKERGYPAKDKK